MAITNVTRVSFTPQHFKALKVTTMHTICELLQSVPMVREKFYEVNKLVGIYLTIPVTTSMAERSFSALCKIKCASTQL